MTDPRVPLKNPLLAVCLGLLFPGGGQLYQGRTFKGVLYAVCIVGTFTYGMFLSDWTALYAGSPLSATNRRWGYLAQAPIGSPAVYALVQQRRYHSPANTPQFGLEKPISASFEGVVRFTIAEAQEAKMTMSELFKAMQEAALKAVDEGREIQIDSGYRDAEYEYYKLTGRIELRPISTSIGPAVEGQFIGHLTLWNPETNVHQETGEAVELKLSSEAGRFELDPPIYADRDRSLIIPVVEVSQQGRPQNIGMLRGVIPRSVGDWLAVPLESEKLNRLHYDLGKTYDLAMIYTWIAALLNVLVLWDAFEGPAYGYGDESSEDDPDDSPSGEKGTPTDKATAKSEQPANSSAPS